MESVKLLAEKVIAMLNDSDGFSFLGFVSEEKSIGVHFGYDGQKYPFGEGIARVMARLIVNSAKELDMKFDAPKTRRLLRRRNDGARVLIIKGMFVYIKTKDAFIHPGGDLGSFTIYAPGVMC